MKNLGLGALALGAVVSFGSLSLARDAADSRGRTVQATNISRDRVEAVVGERNVALRACYDKGLEKNAKLAGTVAVDMTVAETGLVTQASSTRATTMKDSEVVGCVVGVMKSLDFGKQDAEQHVQYALAFEPPQPE
ncbi:MAG: AgmX/PglI C-terminal domain-containing protein [Polyangiaceae bacterium]